MTEHINNRSDWLLSRLNGIGGSEAAAVLDLSPYKTKAELWREKTGKATAEDISEKPYIKYGKAAEKHIRELFALRNPQYTVDYAEFDIIRNDEYPFIFATLDGTLTDKDGRKGILEIKTTEIRRRADWDEWNDWSGAERIPMQYYCQVLHQMIATGFDFAIVCAEVRHYRRKGDMFQTVTTLHRYIDRSEVEDDLSRLKQAEIDFWQNVKDGKEPPLTLPKI